MLRLLSAASLLLAAAAQTIDLGYAQYSPSKPTSDILLYQNIRYAAPPTANNRFAPPQPPLTETEVNDGSVGYACPYAYPQNAMTTTGNNSPYPQSEDCLFLDVWTPSNATDTSALPVMVWIYGGGYTSGAKDLYPGVGFLQGSSNNMIFVAINYRLGAFGFSAGPAFKAQGGTSNLGLLDQAFALKWVKEHISKFGGDPDAVTVAGESAGASSIMFQLSANGGNSTPDFQQAILQSPAFLPVFQEAYVDGVFANFSALANCSTLTCLREADTETLMAANKMQIEENPYYGTFVYGPSVEGDGGFVRALPTVELLTGNFASMPVVVSFVGNESAIFVDPTVSTEAQFNASIESYLPYTNNASSLLDTIATLYPASDYGGSQYGRLAAFVTESLVGCNVRALAKTSSSSSSSSSYVYEFDVGTAHHGSDILYTFIHGYTTITPAQFGLDSADVAIAEGILRSLIAFVRTGRPDIRPYGGGATAAAADIVVLSDSGVASATDPFANARCDGFWIPGAYDPGSALVASRVVVSSSSSSTSSSSMTGTASATATTTGAGTASNVDNSKSQTSGGGGGSAAARSGVYALSLLSLIMPSLWLF